MTRPEIHVCLANKVEAAWTAYHEKVLQLPSSSVYAMAHELSERLGCVLRSIWETEQNMEEKHGPKMEM